MKCQSGPTDVCRMRWACEAWLGTYSFEGVSCTYHTPHNPPPSPRPPLFPSLLHVTVRAFWNTPMHMLQVEVGNVHSLVHAF